MSGHLVVGLVSPQSVTLYWYIVRASGFVAYLLLTTGVLSGLLLSLRWRSNAWPRLLTEEMHQFLQLTGIVFLAIHVLSTLLDTFIRFQWYEVLIPFMGPYRVVWMACGIIAMYLAMALAFSIYMRRKIGYRAWRTLHYAGFAAWLLALAHGLTTGTDTRTVWGMAVYAMSAAAVTGLLAVRLGGVPLRVGRPPYPRPFVLTGLVLVLLLSSMLTVAGPLQRGWAARVGAVPAPTAVIAVPVAFHDNLRGTAQPFNQYSLDAGYRMLTLTLTGTGQYPISLSYLLLAKGAKTGPRFIRGLFSMAPRSLAWSCSGLISVRPPRRLTSVCRATRRETLRIVAQVTIDAQSRVTGTLVVTPF
ncbi:MAG: hypothetical protein NVS4B2_26470 [Chloroflexota bacterium]